MIRTARRGHQPRQLITDPETSARLARVRQGSTAPELVVRRVLRLDDEVDRQYLGRPAKNDYERVVALLNFYGKRLAKKR